MRVSPRRAGSADRGQGDVLWARAKFGRCLAKWQGHRLPLPYGRQHAKRACRTRCASRVGQSSSHAGMAGGVDRHPGAHARPATSPDAPVSDVARRARGHRVGPRHVDDGAAACLSRSVAACARPWRRRGVRRSGTPAVTEAALGAVVVITFGGLVVLIREARRSVRVVEAARHASKGGEDGLRHPRDEARAVDRLAPARSAAGGLSADVEPAEQLLPLRQSMRLRDGT